MSCKCPNCEALNSHRYIEKDVGCLRLRVSCYCGVSGPWVSAIALKNPEEAAETAWNRAFGLEKKDD
jgi:hypothetical protein